MQPSTPSSRHSSCPSRAAPQAGDPPAPSGILRRTGARVLGRVWTRGGGVEDRQTAWGQHSRRSPSSLFLSLLFCLKKPKQQKTKMSLISHNLKSWPESRVWFRNG